MSLSTPHVLVFLLFIFPACAPMAEIGIQVLEPAAITMPAGVDQIAFMNHSAFPYFLERDSSGWTDEEYYILDTLVNRWIFMGVRNSMSSSPLYQFDTIKVIQRRQRDTTGMMEPLSSPALQKIREVHNADALLSLEFYRIDDSLSMFQNLGEYPWIFEAFMGLVTKSLWRLYDLTGDSIIDQYTIRDTMTWYAYDENANRAIAKLPNNMIDAIRAAALQTGMLYGNRISPQWQNVQRYYYISGGKEMKRASELLATDDWLSAAGIWKKFAYSEKHGIAAKACFNMALTCEMEDLMIPAIDWANKSYLIKPKPLTADYLKLLQKRTSNLKKLDMQVPSEIN